MQKISQDVVNEPITIATLEKVTRKVVKEELDQVLEQAQAKRTVWYAERSALRNPSISRFSTVSIYNFSKHE